MGERVTAGRRKLEHELALRNERVKLMESTSPETMELMVESIEECFALCSPFLEGTLMAAFRANPERVEEVMTTTTRKVLTAPIVKGQWDWFRQYVLPSSVWLLRTADDSKFVFERLMEIANELSQGITDEMDAIYDHLKAHKDWDRVTAIQSETMIYRQDHDDVGLLKDDGITGVIEAKQQEDDNNDEEEETQKLRDFVESNLAVSKLTATAKRIDPEFQSVMKSVMTRFGEYKAGPIKKVDRCVSKLENDYQDAAFPKAARLLDLVRCSVSFNTITQLVAGYHGFMKFIEQSPETMKVARVKNGFIGDVEGGYRDLKICVVFTSAQEPELKMICEVQLILNQYLFEKKKMHKLYSVIRDEVYYQMVVQTEEDTADENEVDINKLKFEPILKLEQDVRGSFGYQMARCTVQSDLQMLCIKESWGDKVSVIDVMDRKVLFQTVGFKKLGHVHKWLTFDDRHYLSVQSAKNEVKFFCVDSKTKSFDEDESLRITWNESDDIHGVEYDKNAENMFFVKNGVHFEQRHVSGDKEVVMKMKLKEAVKGGSINSSVCVSDDGSLCVISGGPFNPYWFLIDVVHQKQTKVTSDNLKNSYTPCFINGANDYVAIAGEGVVEIWSVATKSSLRVLECDVTANSSTSFGEDMVYGMCSVQNILAVGSRRSKLRLFDVRTWEMVHSKEYQIAINSLHLTPDLKYLTIGGVEGEKCIVTKLQ